MSGGGRPALQIPRAPGLRVGVVATSWHADITDTLVERAVWVAPRYHQRRGGHWRYERGHWQ